MGTPQVLLERNGHLPMWRGMDAKHISVVRMIVRWVFGAACLMSALGTAQGAQERFAELQVNGVRFTNVVVTGKTAKDLFIRHAGGIATIKLHELDRSTLEQLGMAPPPAPASSKSRPSKKADAAEQKGYSEVQQTDSTRSHWIHQLRTEYLSWQVLLLIVVGVPLAYLLFCRSCWQLCRRGGSPSDVLVWFPILKRLALFKVAGVSWLWFFLGWVIPFVGACAWILCCLRLCEIFRCTRWWTLIMIWPLIGWPVFMYLAWTSRADDEEPALRYRQAA